MDALVIQDYEPNTQAKAFSIEDLQKMGFILKAEQSVREEMWDTTYYLLQLSDKNLSDINGLSLVSVSIKNEQIPLTQLKGLALLLRSNRLVDVAGVLSFRSLRALDLSRNNLISFIDSRYKFEWLQYLDISFNRLTYLAADVGQLGRLLELRIANNQFAALPEALGNLNELEVLDVSNNNLREIPNSLCKLKRLRVFNSMHNPFGHDMQERASSLAMILYRLAGTISLQDQKCFQLLLTKKSKSGKSYTQVTNEWYQFAKEQALAYGQYSPAPQLSKADLYRWLKKLLLEGKLFCGNPLNSGLPANKVIPIEVRRAVMLYLVPTCLYQIHMGV